MRVIVALFAGVSIVTVNTQQHNRHRYGWTRKTVRVITALSERQSSFFYVTTTSYSIAMAGQDKTIPPPVLAQVCLVFLRTTYSYAIFHRNDWTTKTVATVFSIVKEAFIVFLTHNNVLECVFHRSGRIRRTVGRIFWHCQRGIRRLSTRNKRAYRAYYDRGLQAVVQAVHPTRLR